MKIYVATSWRNAYQPEIVLKLRAAGHEVYDFRNPRPGENGFAWSEIDPNWKAWTREEFIKALENPIASHGFTNDFRAMRWADAVVMVLPCGNSAHMECGYFTGQGKRSIVYLADGSFTPDLMYLQADHICQTFDQVLEALK